MAGDSNLDNLWENILSRQDDQVRTAFASRNEKEKVAILEHLRRMATEPGWHAEQRLSAEAALRALGKEYR